MIALFLAALFCFSGCSAAGNGSAEESEKEAVMAEDAEGKEEEREEEIEGEWQEISLPLKKPEELEKEDIAFGTFSGTDIVLSFEQFLNNFGVFIREQEIAETPPVLKKKVDKKKVYYQAQYSDGMSVTMEQDRNVEEDRFTKIELKLPGVEVLDDLTPFFLYCYSATLVGEPYGEKDEGLGEALAVMMFQAFDQEGDVQAIQHTAGGVYYRMLYQDGTFTFSLQPLVNAMNFGEVIPEDTFVETYNTLAAYFADVTVEEPLSITSTNGNTVQDYSYEDGSGYFYLEENADGSQYSKLLLVSEKTDDISKIRFFMRSVLLYTLCSPDIYVDLGELFYEAGISSDGKAGVMEKGVWCFFAIEDDNMTFFVSPQSASK